MHSLWEPNFVNICSIFADLFNRGSEQTSLIIGSLQKYRCWITRKLSSDKSLETTCTPSKSSGRRLASRSVTCSFSGRKHKMATKALSTFLLRSWTNMQPLVNQKWAARTGRDRRVQNILCKQSWHASQGATYDILNVFLLRLVDLCAVGDFWVKVSLSFNLSQDALFVQDVRSTLTVI